MSLNACAARVRSAALGFFVTASLMVSAASNHPGSGEPQIPPPQDIEYPGVIELKVDATDVVRRIFDVEQTIPVAKPGRFTLLYPKWIPGGHSPRGTIHLIGGLSIQAKGQPLRWSRDTIEVTAFHVDVPSGVSELEVRFQFLSPLDTSIGRVVMTPDMLNLQWLSTAFYPAGYYVSRISVEPSVKLPEEWKFGCALETKSSFGGAWVKFKRTTFDTLMDSPMFAGRHYARHTLSAPGEPPVRMHLVADSPEHLQARTSHIAAHRKLVREAVRLFGSRHYQHYDFLVALSTTLGRIGLEHHQSSENLVTTRYFTEWDKAFVGRDLLPHEFAHSWNGKFRRPADLTTPDYHVPMQNSLLWVYEGQTMYWGEVLAARSGLMTSTQVLESIAVTAANFQQSKGREWRSLEDTTHDPIVAYRRPLSWRNYQRSEDYYHEGSLIWLDVDTLIREKTSDQKSLDDFAARFFGVNNGSLGPVTYQFEDVVKTLNEVTPHDWAKFLKERVEGVNTTTVLDGITRGGYRLVFTNERTEYIKGWETRSSLTDFTHSLGFTVGEGNALPSVAWGSPAFKAGLSAGITLIAVNGDAYTAEKLRSAIKQTTRKSAPIELLVKQGTKYRTVSIEYRGGLRYPKLERIPGTKPRLDQILTATTPDPAPTSGATAKSQPDQDPGE
jgi:predicted metalloprotease with PDZ domain